MKQKRDDIREAVFARDNHKCVIPWCKNKPDDAHHLIERKIWGDEDNGGYLIDNLVSVCNLHHMLCEHSVIHPTSLREWAGIKNIVLPKTFDPSLDYGKWGHIHYSPQRENIKYPHTPYLPFSPNADEKDVVESGYMQLDLLLAKPLHITYKMDGSNVVLTTNYVAARNGYDATHVSFDMLKQIHSQFKSKIPENLMIFGEWLYAKHSIHYVDDMSLTTPLQIFGVYNKSTHMWLDIVDTEKIVNFLDNPLVSMASGVKGYDNRSVLLETKVFITEKDLRSALIRVGNKAISEGHEGIVVRNPYAFHHSLWQQNIAKYVRANHVQTDEHWRTAPMVRNQFEVKYV